MKLRKKIFRQSIAIPMNSETAQFLANSFLHYEKQMDLQIKKIKGGKKENSYHVKF